jgi:DNA (cytosine-5)-methyltransferase 1
MKILNLYAGIGGNRKLWGDSHEITAIEFDEKIAKIYHSLHPNDTVLVEDAHAYLESHVEDFDFIWSSPPCPTHSRIRKARNDQNPPVFPNMKLYEEIIFLQGYAECKWVVENVISWYDPLIKPYEVGGHYFWSNFFINNHKFFGPRNVTDCGETIKSLQEGRFDLSTVDTLGVDKVKILRNCVEPALGKFVFDCAFATRQKKICDEPETP